MAADNEGPQHKVTIAKPFAVGKFEVTFAEWDARVASRACKHKPQDWPRGRGKRPVSKVSWDHITEEYLPWLSRKTGRTYRLLTEAEWEYAARAGTTTPFSTGETITDSQASLGWRWDKPYQAGSFAANAFGLHDMHGSVWEWVADCYSDSYTGVPDDGSPVASANCTHRVIRGGSASIDRETADIEALRSAKRVKFAPDIKLKDVGLAGRRPHGRLPRARCVAAP
jgi:formylglycine-generating enzyme required for sulfatase activity